jgi:hypothetical protein
MAQLQNLLTQLQEHLTKTTAEVACQTDPYDIHSELSNIWPNILQSYLNAGPTVEPTKKKARTGVAAKQPLHTCPKCQTVCAYFESEIQEKFGVKTNGKHQSWCRGCRHGCLPLVTPTTPPSTAFFDEGQDMEDGAEDDFADLMEKCDDKLYDESTEILHRKDCIYVASRNGGRNHGFLFHDTLKRKTETWDDAEYRHLKENHPLMDKREKLLKIIADQEKTHVNIIRKELEHMTTVELFYQIKKDSPLLLKSLSAKDIH